MVRFLLLTSSVLSISEIAVADPVTFNRDVRPILSDKCFHCHGPDSATREADLRLDQELSATLERDGYHVIKAGDAKSSELIKRILSDDADDMMPPPDSGRSLSDTEKQTLLKWIEQGAQWERHWSFIAPQRPQRPTVGDGSWSNSAVDDFALRRLQEAGLRPSAETAQTTWLRRVSFDLTGLPPTLEEVDAFLADDSDTAFETVVDRLLNSKHYGEQMAAAWLDAARYADTDGYQNDGPRTMFRYRDWVIDAFNSNMPFDQFTIEQLAGDLLPNASLSQKIATGFNRNHRYNSEAGLVLEEFLLENAVDRVDTTSTVWMGLTVGCARCHDHKYDPIEQREYYQLISFFDNITESGRAIKFGNSEPWLVAPVATQQQQLEDLDQKIRATADSLQELRQQVFKAGVERYLREVEMPDFDPDRTVLVSNGLKHHFLFEDMQAEGITIEKGGPVLRAGLHGNSATVGGNGILALGAVGDVSCQARSSVSFWLKPEALESGVVLSRQAASDLRPGFSVELRDGHLQFYIITRWIAGVGAVETTTTLKPDEWVHVTLTNDGSQRARGQQVWLNGNLETTKILHNTNSNTGGTKGTAVLRIGGGVHGELFQGQVDDLRFYNRTLFADEIELQAERMRVSEILRLNPAESTARMQEKFKTWILAEFGHEGMKDTGNPLVLKAAAARRQLLSLRLKRTRLMDSFPTTMVMEERSGKSETTIRLRGVYDAHGEVVASDVPAIFPQLPKLLTHDSANRHDFAKWLVSGAHPLTARVMVNRFWQQYFGTGLVKTSADFGMQGELPSHPQLLDWLAVEFVESGWDVKALQKLIVLSATYRQSSRHTQRNAAVADPENRLLWRGPRIRLSARQLRDQALSVSGLLTSDVGGASVSPYQPAKLWAEMSNMKYRQSKGADLYRRGLYTIWKRTVAPPSLAILDAADRENCAVRQTRTNTPLQALTLLNETTFVEAARNLAVRMLAEGGDNPIGFAFRTVTARQPTDKEYVALQSALTAYRDEFAADPAKAKQLLTVGDSKPAKGVDQIELAAGTMLCNVLLNLDEVVTKE